ncbi:MAG: hypothetical protein ABI142_06700 [Bryocella sp.]
MSDMHSGDNDKGLHAALNYPLFSAIFNRRSRRISAGIETVPAGTMTYTSTQSPQPLSALEEALLIAATGITGVTMPDGPFQTPQGGPLLGSPLMNLNARAASSPDNAQGTHFILSNDSGTYLLKEPENVDPFFFQGELTGDKLIAYTELCKVRLQDKRLDMPREFPCYVGRNRYVSNVAGSTILIPIVDLTRQYINGMMYLLSQDEGRRPNFIDDWNFYRNAGTAKWVKNGFLNKKIPIPLGFMNTFRIHIEADLLIQNLLLTIQAMGLGGWVHAAFAGPYLLGSPDTAPLYGKALGFRYQTPKVGLLRKLRKAITPLPAWQPNPVGLDGLLEGLCPPYYNNMSEAVDALINVKYGKDGLYTDPKYFDKVFKPELAGKYCGEVTKFTPDVIACCKDICNYIYDTYGRFPAHVDAMYVPGVQVQAHHLDLAYYDEFYTKGYTDTQADHQNNWHGGA